jgi:hypothetical protein
MPTATPDQLKQDIDTGRTGDKVCAADPAAAPLCTDDEAAGTPVDPDLIAKVRDIERKKAVGLGDPATAERRDRQSAIGVWFAAVALTCGMVAATIVLLAARP